MSNSDDNYQLLDAIKNAYELGEIDEFESITTDEEELLNRADVLANKDIRSGFRVVAQSGYFFLKRISDSFDEKPLIASEKFLVWTCDRNLELAPELKRTVDRQTHLIFDQSRYQLFEFVEQKSRNIWMLADVSDTDCRLAGATLARMHLAGLEYLDLSLKTFDDQWDGSYLPSVKNAWEGVGERLKGDTPQAQKASKLLQPDFVKLSEKLEATLTHLEKEASGEDREPVAGDEILVHGDFHPGNVLFPAEVEAAKRAYIVDFDHMHLESPLYDLSYALIMFAKSSVGNSGSASLLGTQKVDMKLAEAFLDSYFAVVAALPPYSSRVVNFKKTLSGEHAAHNLIHYLSLACYLILDWAVEKLVSGPSEFSDIYTELIEMTTNFLLNEPIHELEEVWLNTLKKYVI